MRKDSLIVETSRFLHGKGLAAQRVDSYMLAARAAARTRGALGETILLRCLEAAFDAGRDDAFRRHRQGEEGSGPA